MKFIRFLSFNPHFSLIVLILLNLYLLGCYWTVKGPVGQDDKGVGLSVPVLDLFKKDTYTPEQLSPENIDAEQFNPVGNATDKIPDKEPFTRYDEKSDSL